MIQFVALFCLDFVAKERMLKFDATQIIDCVSAQCQLTIRSGERLFFLKNVPQQYDPDLFVCVEQRTCQEQVIDIVSSRGLSCVFESPDQNVSFGCSPSVSYYGLAEYQNMSLNFSSSPVGAVARFSSLLARSAWTIPPNSSFLLFFGTDPVAANVSVNLDGDFSLSLDCSLQRLVRLNGYSCQDAFLRMYQKNFTDVRIIQEDFTNITLRVQSVSKSGKVELGFQFNYLSIIGIVAGAAALVSGVAIIVVMKKKRSIKIEKINTQLLDGQEYVETKKAQKKMQAVVATDGLVE